MLERVAKRGIVVVAKNRLCIGYSIVLRSSITLRENWHAYKESKIDGEEGIYRILFGAPMYLQSQLQHHSKSHRLGEGYGLSTRSSTK